MILFTCRAGWNIPFDFVKHVVREYGMGGSTQVKAVSEILQSELYLISIRSIKENSNSSHPKGVSATPVFPSITFVRQKLWRGNFGLY